MASAARATRFVKCLQQTRLFSSSPASLQLEQAPIKVFGVEGRYAHALFSAASKSNSLEKVEGELNKVQDLLNSNEQLSEFCYDPTINKIEKHGVLAEGNRLKRAEGIIGAFGKIMRAKRGEVDCMVTTAKPLDAATMKTLAATLQKFVKPNETLKIETETDASVIGGMVINLGDYFIDMSTASKIKKISRALKGAE